MLHATFSPFPLLSVSNTSQLAATLATFCSFLAATVLTSLVAISKNNTTDAISATVCGVALFSYFAIFNIRHKQWIGEDANYQGREDFFVALLRHSDWLVRATC